MMMCWGHISTAILHHACLLFLQDLQSAKAGTLDTTLIQDLAHSGTYGKHADNLSRDLLKVGCVLRSISFGLEQYSYLGSLVVLAH